MLTRDWYAMHDVKQNGMMPIKPADAPAANKRGYGIFWAVNQFKGARVKENLVRINSWYIEIDQGTKEAQEKLVSKFCYPSLVIETKRGFHIYWNAENATAERYNEIVKDRIGFNLNADRKVHDIARVLRVPGFYHMKDPGHPFLVRTVWEYPVSYTEEQMLWNFPAAPRTPDKERQKEMRKIFAREGDDFWEKVYGLDCELALERVSGTAAVSGDVFTFRRVSSGKLNIIANGKQTSCFVDSNKRIGSTDGGGPSIFQWINWYHRDNKKTYQFIKEYFPELFRGEK